MRIFIYLCGCLFVATASPTSETTTTVTAVAPTLTDLKTLIRQSLPESGLGQASPVDVPKKDINQDESNDESEPTITPTLKIDITQDILLHPEASLFLPEESENDSPSDKLSIIHKNGDNYLDKEYLNYHSHRIHEADTRDINASDKDDSGEDARTSSDEINNEHNIFEKKTSPDTPGDEIHQEMRRANCSKVEFTMESKIVENEWIILFNKYYNKAKRLEILIKRFDFEFEVIDRVNPGSLFDSDFELIRTDSDNVIKSVGDSDLIKAARQQRQFTRSLNFVDEEKSRDNAEPPCTESEESENDVYKKNKLHLPSENRVFRRRSTNSVSGSEFWYGPERFKSRKLLRTVSKPITSELHAESLWNAGKKGQGVKVAVFDTGLPLKHPHFKNIKDRTNWTNEPTLEDGLGHGTFVAGVIASNAECLGLAPDADLHIYRVFTNKQVSYTSWFLDAFNYAILKKIDVLNLSIGGPDFMDVPFVDKVWELSANNVIMVSAIGNDGPLYGTLNNPADQMDVIGVGGIDFENKIAGFSSRGMTTWELPGGYGRVKPDIVTFGSAVRGSNLRSGCRTLTGTSVASPVVTGAIALLLSTLDDTRKELVNPAMMKQALMAGAKRVVNANMYEQGAGALDLIASWKVLQNYSPQASLSPPYIDYSDCPYMWPHCSQPLYFTGQPGIHNVTILNGLAVSGKIREAPTWNPYISENGELLEISLKYSEILWPWCGFIAVIISVSESAKDFEGFAAGYISFTVESHNAQGELVSSTLQLQIRVSIIPTPARQKRILWDQFHNLRYPPGYFPRDNLKEKDDPLDWNGDHIHTNFRAMYQYLRNAGYFVEVLGSHFSCFDASKYGTLLIVDPEEEFFDEELKKLENDVLNHGLNIIVFGEWYNTAVMEKVKFYDENTRQWWIPNTGGANIPALNELLTMFDIEFGDFVAEGEFSLASRALYYASGTTIKKFPSNGSVFVTKMLNQGGQVLSQKIENGEPKVPEYKDVAVLGITEKFGPKSGRIGVYGDSNCLDSAHMKHDCFWMLTEILSELSSSNSDDHSINLELQEWSDIMASENGIYLGNDAMRLERNQLHRWSRVLQDSLTFDKKPMPPCPTSNWVQPRPINETLIWKHRPLLAIDLDKVPLEDESSLPLIIDSYFPMGLSLWLLIVLASFVMIIFLFVQMRWPRGVAKSTNQVIKGKKRSRRSKNQLLT